MGDDWGDLSFLLRWAMEKEPESRWDLAKFIEHLKRVRWRLLAERRAGARSLPFAETALAVALTERALPVWLPGEEAGVPPASGVRAAGPTGPIPMPAAGPGQPEPEERETVLPPPSSSAAPTVRTIDVRAAAPPPTSPMAVMAQPLAVRLATTQPMVDPDRRSTGIPVESRVASPAKVSCAVPVLTVGALLLALGLAAAGWFVFGGTPNGPDRPPALAAPTPPSASASSTARPPPAPLTATGTPPAPSGRRGPLPTPTVSAPPK
jgi:hypothetical protein